MFHIGRIAIYFIYIYLDVMIYVSYRGIDIYFIYIYLDTMIYISYIYIYGWPHIYQEIAEAQTEKKH